MMRSILFVFVVLFAIPAWGQRAGLSESRAQVTESGGKTVITISTPDTLPYIGVCADDLSTSCTTDSGCTGTGDDYCVHSVCFDGANAGLACDDDTDCPSSECLGYSNPAKIEITLDTTYTTGTFANGDVWVEADGSNEVTIESVKPPTLNCSTASSSCRNGWDVDQARGSGSSAPPNRYDGRISNASTVPYSSAQLGTFPYTVSSITDVKSFIKVVSGGGDESGGGNGCDGLGGAGHSCLTMAGVLTLVPNGTSVPTDAYRPPYMADKGEFSSSAWLRRSDLNLSKIARLDSADLSSAYSVSANSVEEYMEAPIFGQHWRNTGQQGMTTLEQGQFTGLSHYHQNLSEASSQRLLSALVDLDPTTGQGARIVDKIIQRGIDAHGIAKAGWDICQREKDLMTWIGFLAHVSEDSLYATGFASGFSGSDGDLCFSEIDTFYDSPRYGSDHPGDYLWGYTASISSWNNGDGTWIGDPAGYIDGCGRSYMYNQAIGPWSGFALFWLLNEMPLTVGDLTATPWITKTSVTLSGFDWADNGSASHDTWTCGCVSNDVAYNGGDPYAHGTLVSAASCDTDGGHDCSGSGSGPRESSWHNSAGNASGNACSLSSASAYYALDMFNVPATTQGFWEDFRDCAYTKEGDWGTSATYPCNGMPSTLSAGGGGRSLNGVSIGGGVSISWRDLWTPSAWSLWDDRDDEL